MMGTRSAFTESDESGPAGPSDQEDE